MVNRPETRKIAGHGRLIAGTVDAMSNENPDVPAEVVEAPAEEAVAAEEVLPSPTPPAEVEGGGAQTPESPDAGADAGQEAEAPASDVTPADEAVEVTEVEPEPVAPTMDELLARTDVTIPVPAGVFGEVHPGDTDGLSFFVVRQLGLGDGGRYEGAAVEFIKQKQSESGIEPTGIVSWPTWALILPDVTRQSMGQPVQMLMTAMGKPAFTSYDDDFEQEIRALQEEHNLPVTGYVDGETWRVIGNAGVDLIEEVDEVEEVPAMPES